MQIHRRPSLRLIGLRSALLLCFILTNFRSVIVPPRMYSFSSNYIILRKVGLLLHDVVSLSMYCTIVVVKLVISAKFSIHALSCGCPFFVWDDATILSVLCNFSYLREQS
jgi:hypothetical protein